MSDDHVQARILWEGRSDPLEPAPLMVEDRQPVLVRKLKHGLIVRPISGIPVDVPVQLEPHEGRAGLESPLHLRRRGLQQVGLEHEVRPQRLIVLRDRLHAGIVRHSELVGARGHESLKRADNRQADAATARIDLEHVHAERPDEVA